MPFHPDFDKIRPFHDSEVKEAIGRIISEKGFLKVAQYFFPNYPVDVIIENLKKVETIQEFQTKFVLSIEKKIIATSTKGVSWDGIENLEKDKGYLYITNHRDIILDSAILNEILYENGFNTTKIAIGSNLLILPWITDLVKLNKTFIVKRSISARELYEYSNIMSAYMRYILTENKESIWIAQREGRTKNGDDKTQPSLVKMLGFSKNGKFSEVFGELNIVPVAISYEYEPCDVEKVSELYARQQDKTFKKTKVDDLMSMGKGLVTQKGRVHFSFSKPITIEELTELDKMENKNEQIIELGLMIDKQIHKNFKLRPTNYIAYDWVNKTQKFEKEYTQEEKKSFTDYIHRNADYLKGDKADLTRMLLEIYSNPVKNHISVL